MSSPLNLFLDRLLGDSRGIVVVCNIVDGISENLFSPEDVKSYFSWWISLCDFIGAGTITKMLAAMDQMTSLDRLPPGFKAGQDCPPFLFSCGRPLPGIDGSEVSMVAPALILSAILDDGDKDRLAANLVEFPINGSGDWADNAIQMLLTLPDSERRVSLGQGKVIGNTLVWVTPREAFERCVDGHLTKADRAKDALGLVHRNPNDVLVVLHLPSSIMKPGRSGRPTFMDAGSHRRFRALPHGPEHKCMEAWGSTLDLERFASSAENQDGLLERVTAPVPKEALDQNRKISFNALGRVAFKRGDTSNDNDEAFARSLLRDRTVADLKADIERIVQ